MEWVLQKSVEIKHAINSLQQLELLKIDMEEAMTYWKHPPKLWHIKIELEILRELIWDPIKNQNQAFWYHEIDVRNPHIRERNWSIIEAKWKLHRL